VVLAGPVEAAARATPLFEAISQGRFQLGERPEGANVVKLAGNFLITSMLRSARGSLRVLPQSRHRADRPAPRRQHRSLRVGSTDLPRC
jgi:hypothetical protein